MLIWDYTQRGCNGNVQRSVRRVGCQVALFGDCSDPTSNGQVSMLQCHPWIGTADTQSTRRIYNRVAITHLLHRVSQERNKYDKYGLRPSKTITAKDLEDK